MMFDRVILLSEGYTIYNGPPSHVKDYFDKYGLVMSRYSNPADKLSIIASEPYRVLKAQDVDIVSLSRACKQDLKSHLFIEEEERQTLMESVSNDFSRIAKTREVSFGKQYCLIFKRFMLYSIRTPISVVAFAFMAIF